MRHAHHLARHALRLSFKTTTIKIRIVGAATVSLFVFLALTLALTVTALQASISTLDMSDLARTDIPTVAQTAYQQAAANACDEITWPILAGIGKVESDHGRHNGATLLPNGHSTPPILGPELDGTGTGGNTTPLPVGQWHHQWGLSATWQQALGPMQFLPGTFAHYAPSPEATPHNIHHAAQAAANLLCDHNPNKIETAVLAYNHSTDYVDQVLHWAALYTRNRPIATTTALSLTEHPNLTLTPAARRDLQDGIVDPRLVNLLNHLATTHQLDILSFKTGHPRCKVLPNQINTGPNCNISNHSQGRAVDITAISPTGQPLQAVSPHNNAAREITEWLATMPTNEPIRPDEVGSPWTAYDTYHGHFTNTLHQDHLHIGYTS
jgi:hypothetical protein